MMRTMRRSVSESSSSSCSIPRGRRNRPHSFTSRSKVARGIWSVSARLRRAIAVLHQMDWKAIPSESRLANRHRKVRADSTGSRQYATISREESVTAASKSQCHTAPDNDTASSCPMCVRFSGAPKARDARLGSRSSRSTIPDGSRHHTSLSSKRSHFTCLTFDSLLRIPDYGSATTMRGRRFSGCAAKGGSEASGLHSMRGVHV